MDAPEWEPPINDVYVDFIVAEVKMEEKGVREGCVGMRVKPAAWQSVLNWIWVFLLLFSCGFLV